MSQDENFIPNPAGHVGPDHGPHNPADPNMAQANPAAAPVSDPASAGPLEPPMSTPNQVPEVTGADVASQVGGEPEGETQGGGAKGVRLSRDIVVRALDVKKVYPMKEAPVHALRGVNLDIYRGEYMAIMGPSGSGKSTLFNMIGGLDKPTSGMVFIDEVDVAALDSYELAWMRCRKIGYIFQSFNLLPTLTALENVTLPMIFANIDPDEARDRAYQLLVKVGLGDRWQNRPGKMSGGQQQRVAVARALANSPTIVLADEPTANLDLKTGAEVIAMLKDLCREMGVTVISATHDHKMLDICERVVWVRDGRIERIEKREDLKIEVGSIEGEGH
jgi:putative ABC transport system ATP-binding protein